MDDSIFQNAARTQSKHFGKYRGFVADNKDPEKRGRLRLKVPSLLSSEISSWALPCLPFGGLPDQGLFMIPEVDAQVWVEFEEGNLHAPIWTGVFWQQTGDVPSEASLDEPTTRILKTPSGHILQFDDESGKEKIRLYHPKESELSIDENGTVILKDGNGEVITLNASDGKVTVEDANGNSVVLDASGTQVKDSNGNEITMSASGITLKGTKILVQGSQVALGADGGELLIKGTTFLSWLATHTHNCTAPGSPSGPPVPPPNPSLLTTKTMAS